jgi:hypothetical protein
LATDGQVPGPSLVRMGLAGLQPLSDSQGSQIRGQSIHESLVQIRITTFQAVPEEKVVVIPNTQIRFTYTTLRVVPVERIIVVPVPAGLNLPAGRI